MVFVIAQPCVDVKDKACLDVCPIDCIYEGERSLYIHPDECIDCQACEPVCPVEAIFPEAEVPGEWSGYTRANAEFFEISGIGSPGSAGDVGPAAVDHPLVTALPRPLKEGHGND
ncbi:ferredoxin [Streptomyces cellostaticus]|uniref:ferredoxin n=1 Tax=Streptomyces TaxID=1883 RepID=UPI0020261E47|nr:ferredoxin [Streptomyces cellostaticus]